MPRVVDPWRRALPFADWPAADRAACDAMFATGDIFAAGPARHWRPATRKTNRAHYARWLGWLAVSGRLDPEVAPAERITQEAVTAYARHLLDIVASTTVAAMITGLKEVARMMAPAGDWRWLKDLSNRLKVQAKPSIDRSAAVRSSIDIREAMCAGLDAQMAGDPSARAERFGFRDRLMALVLCVCPLRNANFHAIRLERHLTREGVEWALRFEGAETKTHRPLRHVLPAWVNPYLETWLAVVRPAFRPAPGCSALWLGHGGRPIKPGTVYGRIVALTGSAFALPINPHLFRSCAATTIVDEAPEMARIAAPLLGHAYEGTTTRYYVKAQQRVATRRVHAALAALKTRLAGATEEEDPA